MPSVLSHVNHSSLVVGASGEGGISCKRLEDEMDVLVLNAGIISK